MDQNIPLLPTGLAWLVAALFCIALVDTVRLWQRARKLSITGLALVTCGIMGLLNGVFHLLFHTPYLFARTALVLYPLLVLGLMGWADELLERVPKLKPFLLVALLGGSLLLGYNFYKSFSPHYFREWPVQTDTEVILQRLEGVGARSVAMNEWHYAVYANYYCLKDPGRFSFSAGMIYPQSFSPSDLHRFEYLLLSPGDYSPGELKDWQLLAYYPRSGAHLYKRTIVP